MFCFSSESEGIPYLKVHISKPDVFLETTADAIEI